MSQHRERRHAKRVLAGIGVAALTLLGTVSVSTAASALTVNNINPDATASLTIHKHAGTPATTGNNGTEITDSAAFNALGAGLDGVGFSVERVRFGGHAIDLETATGWDQAQGATVAKVTAGLDSYDKEHYANVVTGTDGTGIAELLNMPFGLYLVTETSPGAHQIVSPVEPFLVSVPYPAASTSTWIYDVHVYPKNKLNETVPTKEVARPDSPFLGQSFDWTINAPVPEIATADEYKSFIITDTLDPRLSFGSATVKIGTTDAVLGTHYSLSGTQTIVITLLDGGLDLLDPGSPVTVKITTTVTSLTSGDLPAGEIENRAIVRVNDSQKTTGPAKTNWGPLQVVKVANDAQRPLDGAQFTLHESKDGPAIEEVGTLTSGSNGLITVDGLWVGNGETLKKIYWLKETKAPAGYVLPIDGAEWTEYEVTAGALSDDFVPQPIPNTQQPGPNLPLTGSAGTLIFMGGGLGLVLLAAGATMMASRKKQHDTANTVE